MGTDWTANDPHGANIEWRAAPVSRCIHWQGEWGPKAVQEHWTSDLSKWLATPERVALWTELQGKPSGLSERKPA